THVFKDSIFLRFSPIGSLRHVSADLVPSDTAHLGDLMGKAIPSEGKPQSRQMRLIKDQLIRVEGSRSGKNAVKKILSFKTCVDGQSGLRYPYQGVANF